MKLHGVIVVLIAGLGLGNAGADVEGTRVLALSVSDGRAVVRVAGGEMRTLKEGDRLPGSEAVVTEVLADRLVVEEFIAAEPPRRETIWIYKAVDGVSRVRRLGRVGPGGNLELRENVRAAQLVEPGQRR